MKKETASSKDKNLLSIVGLILLLIPFLIWGLWIVAFNSNPSASQEEKMKIYLSYFPSFLRSIVGSSSLTNFIILIIAPGSIIFAILGWKSANKVFKVLGILAIIIAGLIVLLQLFTML